MFSFHESYFRLVGLFDCGYTKTQFFLSVCPNRYVFVLAGYRTEKYATDPALFYMYFLSVPSTLQFYLYIIMKMFYQGIVIFSENLSEYEY